MQIRTDVSLKDYSTMRLGGTAKALTDIHSQDDMFQAITWAEQRHMPFIMIGGGSNIIWRDQSFDGLVMVNKLKGYTEDWQDDTHATITVAAGEIWDDFVARVVRQGLSGIENLSLIPGTVGATPVQNVGAYGQEVADTLVAVQAYDTHSKTMVSIPNADCHFGYRSSRFKTTDRGRYLITAVSFALVTQRPQPPFYASLQQYLDEHQITSYTPQTIRDAVIAVRSAKLPDPKKVANNGSFFANPIVSKEQFQTLHAAYPNLAHWPTRDGKYKIAAAWLLQEAGFKNIHDAQTGMATWPAQVLVLVNEHAPNTAAAMTFTKKITDTVQQKFGIALQQEPELL